MTRLLAVQTLGVLISFIIATFWASTMCIFKPKLVLLLAIDGFVLCALSVVFCIFLPKIIYKIHGNGRPNG